MKIDIVFTAKALQKLEMVAEYVYERTESKRLTRNYLKKLQMYISTTLQTFPKAGRPSDEIYEQTRKLVYQSYSIIYRYDEKEKVIYVLILYRENLP